MLQGKSQRLALNPGSYVIKQGQQLVVLATTPQVAEAGAAGENLEQSQALDAAETAVAAAAAPLTYSAAGLRRRFDEQQHVQQGAAPIMQQQQVVQAQADSQQQQDRQQPQSQQQQQQQRKQQQGQLSLQQQRAAGSRGVIVRVPGLLTEELQRFKGASVAAAASAAAASAAAPSERPRIRVNAAVRGSWQQQQASQTQQSFGSIKQQHTGSSMYPQQQQQQQQSSAPGSRLPAPAASSATATNSYWVQNIAKDVISQPGSRSFSHSNSSIDQIGGSAAPGTSYEGSDLSDAELANLNPCLASWSGAFESDSMDETEVCTDSELLEAALLQRQRQQLREQQQQLQRHAVGQLPGYEVPQMADTEGQERHGVGSGSAGKPSEANNSSSSSTQGDGAVDSSSRQVDLHAAATGNSSSQQAVSDHSSQSDDNQKQLQLSSTATAAASTSSSNGVMHHQQHQQQQQQPQSPGLPPGPPPKHLRGHIIMSGCASSFVQFAEQLHSLASPAVSPVPLVILHTEPPPREVFEAISALGPAYFVRGKSSESAALAAAGAENAR
jgi:hypothetical protein